MVGIIAITMVPTPNHSNTKLHKMATSLDRLNKEKIFFDIKQSWLILPFKIGTPLEI